MSGRRSVVAAAIGVLLVLGLPGPARAAEADAGRAKAQPCAVCHGPLGVSVTPDAPHLAGQPTIYLTRQLKAYRSGARMHEVMTFMARSLSDEDIALLAAWFASLRIEVQPPP